MGYVDAYDGSTLDLSYHVHYVKPIALKFKITTEIPLFLVQIYQALQGWSWGMSHLALLGHKPNY